MSALAIETTEKPSLREIVLDALTDAFWCRKVEVEDCRHCRNNPAGICADPDHQRAAALAREYEEARKRIEHSPGDPEVMDVFAGNVTAALTGEGTAS